MCEFERGTGAQEIYPYLDQRNKVWCENSKGFSGRNRKFKCFSGRKQVTSKKKVFTEISRDFSAEIGISSGFSNFKSTKNTNLRSKAPNLLISLGNSPRLGGHNFRLGDHKQSFGGARPRYAPPWRRVCSADKIKLISALRNDPMQ